MTAIVDAFTFLSVGLGAVFFLAGTLGLIRFPSALGRLHALSKADNLGLGLVILGLLPQATSGSVALKLIGVWLVAQLSAATASQLIAGSTRRDGRRP